MDDAPTYFSLTEEHLGRVQYRVQTLKDASVALNLRKCVVLDKTLHYLGHKVCTGRPQVSKTKYPGVSGS